MEEKSQIRYHMIIMRWGSACLNCGIVLASQSTEFQTSFVAWRLVRLLMLRQTAFDRNRNTSPVTSKCCQLFWDQHACCLISDGIRSGKSKSLRDFVLSVAKNISSATQEIIHLFDVWVLTMSKLLLNVVERYRESCLQSYWHSIDFWLTLSQLAGPTVIGTIIQIT